MAKMNKMYCGDGWPNHPDWKDLSIGRDYSKSEFDTGDKWIDGSPIYCKVIEDDTLATGVNTIVHGITDLGHVLSISGYLTTDSAGDLPLPIVASLVNNNITVQGVDATNVSLFIGTNYAGTYAPDSVALIIKYTKETT